MSYVDPGIDLSGLGRASPRVAVFIGHPGRVSDRMLNVCRAEFADTAFARVAGPDDIAGLSDPCLDPALVVVDADHVEDLLRHTARYTAAARTGTLALAYRDIEPAARLMAARDGDPALARVGFLPLDVQIDVWLSVMRLLLCGVVVYPQTLLAVPDDPVAPDPAVPPGGVPLTAREWQILALVATGKQNKIIADELCLSEHTVKLHVHHVLRKVGATNRTGAATWFSTVQAGGGGEARP